MEEQPGTSISLPPPPLCHSKPRPLPFPSCFPGVSLSVERGWESRRDPLGEMCNDRDLLAQGWSGTVRVVPKFGEGIISVW